MSRRTVNCSAFVAMAAFSGTVVSRLHDTPSVTDPHSPQAGKIASLWWLMAALAAIIYIAVMALVAVSLRNREARGAGDAGSAPDQRRTSRFIVLGGLALPVVTLTIIGVATVATSNALRPGDPTVRVTVDAEQWWWRLTYPDEGVVTANEIHVPVGESVELTLRSENVIHSVWVPQLNGKTDVIPGQTNHMSFTATSEGTYRGQCAEFCGLGHSLMAFLVIAEEPADFRRWIDAHRTIPAAPADETAARGKELFVDGSCAGCHTVSGTSASGTAGPDLTHFGSRRTIAAGTLPNDPPHLAQWLAHTQDVKPGALMPQIDLTPEQVDALVAYLESLR